MIYLRVNFIIAITEVVVFGIESSNSIAMRIKSSTQVPAFGKTSLG